jgi:hypothetical protein
VPGLPAPIKVARVKIFEQVKGGWIEGRTDPGAAVTLEIPVDTNTGRHFAYRARVTSDADGIFAFVVPYAAGVAGDISAGPATVSTPRCELQVSLSEEEVLTGARRPVRCR